GLSQPRLDGAGSKQFPLAANVLPQLWQNIGAQRPYPAQVVFLLGANPVFGNNECNRALEKVPFIVSFSSFMDESAWLADLILPDHTYLERWQDDPTPVSVGIACLLGIRQPVVEPLFDTMHTGDAMLRMAVKLEERVSQSFPWGNFEEVLKFSTAGIFHSGRGAIISGAFEESWFRFLRERGWQYPLAATFEEFWDQLVEAGGWWDPIYDFGERERVYETPSGKFEFFSQNLKRELETHTLKIEPMGVPSSEFLLEELLAGLQIEARGDKVFMPHYEPPRIRGEVKNYPYVLNIYAPTALAGRDGANEPLLLEMPGYLINSNWESWVEINPETASAHRLAEGDWVWVQSPRAKRKVRVKLSPGAMPGVVNIPFGLGHRMYGRYAKDRGINPKELRGEEYDHLGGVAATQSTRVKIYKV
ncbi:MAG: molybdopterin dinucleotide binding domain-containing protein, partial [bacterium]